MRNPTKKDQRAKQNAQEIKEKELENQLSLDENDAKKIEQVLSALLELNADKAYDIIKNTSLSYLIQPRHENDDNSLKCPLALHAVVLALTTADEKITTILNEMTDPAIASLKQSIAIAQQHDCPDKKFIKDLISGYEEQLNKQLAHNERVAIRRKLKSATVAANVIDFWDDAVMELNKWASAINTFKRDPNQAPVQTKAPEKIAQNADELWTIPQLAERLGTTTKKIHNHIARCLKSKNADLIRKINKWFVFETTPKGNKRAHAIYDAYVKSYSELFAKIRQYKRKAKPVVAKPVVVAETPVVLIPDEPKTLLDLKATAATATAIIKLVEIASQYDEKSAELATANKELEAAQKEMYGETDTQKIRTIVGKILDATQNRDQKEIEVATSAKAKELLEQKQSAQADKDNAEQALSDANKKLDDIFLNIATFLESLKQNSK